MNLLLFLLLLPHAMRPMPAAPLKPAEIYVASTPCDSPVRAYFAIPEKADSEFMTWRIVLHPDTRRYEMRYTYGMTVPGTRGFRDGGTTVSQSGSFSVQTGQRTVISLTVGDRQIPFVRIGDGLLHLLDPEGKLMIGNGAWSYTFNRQKP